MDIRKAKEIVDALSADGALSKVRALYLYGEGQYVVVFQGWGEELVVADVAYLAALLLRLAEERAKS